MVAAPAAPRHETNLSPPFWIMSLKTHFSPRPKYQKYENITDRTFQRSFHYQYPLLQEEQEEKWACDGHLKGPSERGSERSSNNNILSSPTNLVVKSRQIPRGFNEWWFCRRFRIFRRHIRSKQ